MYLGIYLAIREHFLIQQLILKILKRENIYLKDVYNENKKSARVVKIDFCIFGMHRIYRGIYRLYKLKQTNFKVLLNGI